VSTPQTGAAGRAPSRGTSSRPADPVGGSATPRRSAAAPGTGLPRGQRRPGPRHSAVEMLLSDSLAAAPGPGLSAATQQTLAEALEAASERAAAVVAGPGHAGKRAERGSTDGPGTWSTTTGLPPVQDVALGAAALAGERLWRVGAACVGFASGAAARAVALLRAVSPQIATAEVDARLQSLAARGQRVRQERSEALGEALSTAITSAATSDAMREMTVAAIAEATDDVLDVVLPAVLDAVTELETQDRLDELMAGLLMRQLPSALERTLPGVMLRTAAKPALGFVPSLMGALASGLAGDPDARDRP